MSNNNGNKNLVDEIASTAEQIRKVRAVRDRTYSRKEFIVGSFSPIAKILMRTRFVLIRGSVHTYSASARSLSDSMADSMSSVFFTPSLKTSSPSLGAASSAAFHLQENERATNVAQESHAINARDNFVQQFQPVTCKVSLFVGESVTLPPGCARLATSPVPTGSPTAAKTIGISEVACITVIIASVPAVTMTSTLRRINSAANAA